MQRCKISQGKPHPLGAIIKGNAVQFALFSRHATSVSLCLFEKPQDPEPLCEIQFDLRLNRTGDIWHILVKGIKTGTYYLFCLIV